MSDLQDTVKLLKRARQIASRWVKAWQPGSDGYGYYDATSVTVDIHSPHYIRFVPCIRDSIGPWHCWMDGKYLDDDTNLETDAFAWYEGQMKRRKAVSDRETELRATPEVTEFLSLTQPQYTTNGSKAFYWHPLHRDIQHY